MAYITKSTYKSILFNWDIEESKVSHRRIYKSPIYMFNNKEEHELRVLQEILENSDDFFQFAYKKQTSVDTYNYVNEGKTPRYHLKIDCPFLKSDYENFEIPNEIKEKGKESVKEFRKWFKSVEELFRKNKGAFAERLRAKYGILVSIKSITKDNSGVTIKENYNVNELEEDIDKLIKSSGRFFYKSNKHTAILKQYSKFSYLGFSSEELSNNNTGYLENEVKDILKEYETTFKRPLKAMLEEYYQIKLNPEISFQGNLLDTLGLKPCFNCCEQ